MSQGESVSQTVNASPEAAYDAFMDPAALVEWLPPPGMSGTMHAFDGRVGGGYEMSLHYAPGAAGPPGKTAEGEDRVRVVFVELSRGRRIVEAVLFSTDDPPLKGEMRIVVDFAPKHGGCEVTMSFADLPPGLSAQDNELGARLSLQQLARRFQVRR